MCNVADLFFAREMTLLLTSCAVRCAAATAIDKSRPHAVSKTLMLVQPRPPKMASKAYDYLFKLLLIGDSGVGKTCVLFRFSDDAFNTTFISTIGAAAALACRCHVAQASTSRSAQLSWTTRRSSCRSGATMRWVPWAVCDVRRDTAGQERFRTITTAYYRGAMVRYRVKPREALRIFECRNCLGHSHGAQGIMLVYDVTNEKSFENIKTWIRNIEQHASDDVEKMILANKCDMEDKRVVTKEQGQKARHCSRKIAIHPVQLAAEFGVMFQETSAKENINIEEAFTQMARAIKRKMDIKVRACISACPTHAPQPAGGPATGATSSGPKVELNSAPAAEKKGCCSLI